MSGPNGADMLGGFFDIVEDGPAAIPQVAGDLLTGGATAVIRSSGVTMADVGKLFAPSEDADSEDD